jgi:quercetin dioxygenase-like cupin family protein
MRRGIHMRRLVPLVVCLAFFIWLAPAVAQTPGTGELVLRPIAAAQGTGVSNVALMNREEIQVLRVDVAPGGVRNVHSHDDVPYHIFVPITGRMRFQVESETPVDLAPWQAFFVKGGTKHGFTNPGTAPVTVMEIFVKK